MPRKEINRIMDKIKDKSVCIVLPTYNGGKYLAKQLDSILEQTWPNCSVYIRDDGSTDETVEIAQWYCRSNSSIHLIQDSIGNLGCPNSFYEIIKRVPEYDYYAFADQDDIWKTDKIERAVRAIENSGDKVPTVYFSSFSYVNEDGETIRESAPQDKYLSFHNTLFYTPGLGFTIVFNRLACRAFILEVDPGNEMHDRWLIRCASAFGKVLFDSVCTASHVRHSSAVTSGDNRYFDLLKTYFKDELFGDRSKDESKMLSHFSAVFYDELSFEQKHELDIFTNDDGIISRLRKVFFPKRLRPTLISDLLLRVLFLFNKA